MVRMKPKKQKAVLKLWEDLDNLVKISQKELPIENVCGIMLFFASHSTYKVAPSDQDAKELIIHSVKRGKEVYDEGLSSFLDINKDEEDER